MNSKRTHLAVALLATVLALPAAADERANAPTITGETGLFTLFSGQTAPQGEVTFGVYYNNWDRVFEFDDTADLDWNRLSASVGYGFTDAFEMSVRNGPGAMQLTVTPSSPRSSALAFAIPTRAALVAE